MAFNQQQHFKMVLLKKTRIEDVEFKAANYKDLIQNHLI